MKRLDLIRQAGEQGAVLIRNGADLDMYRNVMTGVMEPIPRHREICERLARKILRRLAAPEGDGGEQ